MPRVFPVLAFRVHDKERLVNPSYPGLWQSPDHPMGGGIAKLGGRALVRIRFSRASEYVRYPTTVFLPSEDGRLAKIRIAGIFAGEVRCSKDPKPAAEVIEQARRDLFQLHSSNPIQIRLMAHIVQESVLLKRRTDKAPAPETLPDIWHITYSKNLALATSDPQSISATFPRITDLASYEMDCAREACPGITPKDRIMPLSAPARTLFGKTAHERVALHQVLKTEIALLARAHGLTETAQLQEFTP